MKIRHTLRKVLLALALVVIVSNILFWILVGVNFSPVKDEYVFGRIIRVGNAAFVFGHGEWITDEGIKEHYTTAFLRSGVDVKRPTLEVVEGLRREGVRWVWGTWCYSGDHPYVRRDIKSGRQIPWPDYVSRNKKPGETWPVWVGVGFIRISVGSRHREEPALPDAKRNGIRITDIAPFLGPNPYFSQSLNGPMIR
jgi:hypothetical protein